jgi:hypothetical protein
MLSAPTHYFDFPDYAITSADLRHVTAEPTPNHLLVGGGGLLYSRFLPAFQQISNVQRGRLIAWGIGQQTYGHFDSNTIRSFDYSAYLDRFDLVGIRDINMGYNWVPCASCMHSAFDQPRAIEHEFVVFSHRKFQLHLDGLPRMTHANDSLEAVLDFLGSGETILTSSYHGAYWGTLLGRKVLAFPFSSKFATFKHQPGLYPVRHWFQPGRKIQVLGKVLYDGRDKSRLVCETEGWRSLAQDCLSYPESLVECRDRNRWFYQQVLSRIQG